MMTYWYFVLGQERLGEDGLLIENRNENMGVIQANLKKSACLYRKYFGICGFNDQHLI